MSPGFHYAHKIYVLPFGRGEQSKLSIPWSCQLLLLKYVLAAYAGSLVRMIGIRCRYVEKRATVQLREDNVVHIMFCLADQKLWFGNKGVRREHNTTGR
jgi:hypothetical protein